MDSAVSPSRELCIDVSTLLLAVIDSVVGIRLNSPVGGGGGGGGRVMEGGDAIELERGVGGARLDGIGDSSMLE